MRVADPRGLRHPERVSGGGPGHDRLLLAESRQLPTGTHPPELGHHRVDHARRPAARVVLADHPEAGRHPAVLHAPDTRTHRHPNGPERPSFRGTLSRSDIK